MSFKVMAYLYFPACTKKALFESIIIALFINIHFILFNIALLFLFLT